MTADAKPKRDILEALFEEGQAMEDRFQSMRVEMWKRTEDMAAAARMLCDEAQKCASAQGRKDLNGEQRAKAIHAERRRARDIMRCLNTAAAFARIAAEDVAQGEQLVIWNRDRFPGG